MGTEVKYVVRDVAASDVKVGDMVTWGAQYSAHTVVALNEGEIEVGNPSFVIGTGEAKYYIGHVLDKDTDNLAIVLDEKMVPEVGDPSAAPLDVQIGGSHYKDMAIQPLEYCLANAIPFAEGNVIKYVSRWRKKNGVQDLKKARHMLDVLIAQAEKEASA